jgi:hypothetical protein
VVRRFLIHSLNLQSNWYRERRIRRRRARRTNSCNLVEYAAGWPDPRRTDLSSRLHSYYSRFGPATVHGVRAMEISQHVRLYVGRRRIVRRRRTPQLPSGNYTASPSSSEIASGEICLRAVAPTSAGGPAREICKRARKSVFRRKRRPARRPLPRFCIQDRPSPHRLRLPEPRGKTPRVVFDAPTKGCPSAHRTPQSRGRENGLAKIFIREQGRTVR